MEGVAELGLPAEPMEQQQIKPVRFESMQKEPAAASHEAAVATTDTTAPNLLKDNDAEAASDNNTAAHSISPNQKNRLKHRSSRSSKHKLSNDATFDSSSGSSAQDSDTEPVVWKKHGGIKAWRYPGLKSTASFRQLTTIGSCHQYTISGYNLAKALGPGTCLRSDLFEAGGQQFQLEVFPAGLTADMSRHLALFLVTPGSIHPNHVLHQVAVVDQSGRGRHLIRASKPNRQEPSHSFHTGVIAGYPAFVRTALLQQHQSRYLLDDSLVIRVTVEVVRSWAAAPQQLAVPGSMWAPTQQQQQQGTAGFQCFTPQPDYQDHAAVNYNLQQQHAPSNQAQQSCSSSMCMCCACCAGSLAGAHTAGMSPVAAARTAVGKCNAHAQKQFSQLCSCPACMTAEAPAGGGVPNQLGSPVMQQPSRGVISAAAESAGCSCAACRVQKLLQLLPALASVQLAAGGTAATAAAAATVPAAGSVYSKQSGSADAESAAAAGEVVAAAGNHTEIQPRFQDAAAINDVAAQLAHLLLQTQQQLLQQDVSHHSACCLCRTTNRGLHSAAACSPVCGQPASQVATATVTTRKLVGSNCSSAACSQCNLSLQTGTQTALIQGHQQATQQRCVLRQHLPVTQCQHQCSPQQMLQPQLQLQQQTTCCSPPSSPEVKIATSAGRQLGNEALQQVDAAGLVVPLVRHHPARVVYM